MADEGQRLVHKAAGRECAEALLNFDAATLDQVLLRLGLSVSDLPEVQLPAAVVDQLTSLQAPAGGIKHPSTYLQQDEHPAKRPCLSWEQHLESSDAPAAPCSPTPAVKQHNRVRYSAFDDAVDSGAHYQWQPTQQLARQGQQTMQQGGCPGSTNGHAPEAANPGACYNLLNGQHELGDWHMMCCTGVHQGSCVAAAVCSGCQQQNMPEQPWCQTGIQYIPAHQQQQHGQTQLQDPAFGWQAPGMAGNPYEPAGNTANHQQAPCSHYGPDIPCSPPQSSGLTQLQSGSTIRMLCKDTAGAYCYERRLLVDKQLGEGGHAEVWRVRELSAAAGHLQGPGHSQVPQQYSSMPRNVQHQWHDSMRSSWQTDAAAAAAEGTSIAAGRQGTTVAAECKQQAHQAAGCCCTVSEHCMALKLALRHDKVKPNPKQRPERYYQLQQQAMSGEYCTMWAAKQQSKLQHIVEGFDYGDVVYADGVAVPCILMEFAEAGSLKKQLVEQATAADGQPVTVPKGLSTEETWGIVGQIAAGLADLHSMGVIHRDVKCANCVGTVYSGVAPKTCSGLAAILEAGGKGPWQALDSTNTDKIDCYATDATGNTKTNKQQRPRVQWKLCDFGTSRHVTGLTDLVTERVGTRVYRPAETLRDNGGAYSLQVDTYMLDLMFLELRFGRLPFYYLWSAGNLSDQAIKELIPFELDKNDCPYNLGLTSGSTGFAAALEPEEKAFVKHCLAPDQAHRPTAAMLLELYPQLSGERDDGF